MADSYTCKIVDWLDGDTAVLDVTATVFDTPLTIRQHARIFGINAPEVHSTNADEKKRGLAARAFALSISPPGSQAYIAPPKPGEWRDKYGRLLVVMTLTGGQTFATTMINAGCALAWDGQGPKPV
jgi:endonuclease YncB( thermonuclease family)